MNWEKEFNEQFSIGKGRKWILTKEEAAEIKDFVRRVRKEAMKEVLNKTQIGSQDYRAFMSDTKKQARANLKARGWNEAVEKMEFLTQKLLEEIENEK